MRVCGARSWTPQGCIRKTDRYRAVLVAWWVSVARALTMPSTHCGPVISLPQAGAVPSSSSTLFATGRSPSLLSACMRVHAPFDPILMVGAPLPYCRALVTRLSKIRCSASRSPNTEHPSSTTSSRGSHPRASNSGICARSASSANGATAMGAEVSCRSGSQDFVYSNSWLSSSMVQSIRAAANSRYSLRAPVSASSWPSCIYPFAPVSGVRMSCESADRSRWNRCCSRACSTRSRSAASSSALTLRAISLSPVSGALMFSRAAERGSRRDSARAMRRSSRAYRPQVAMTPKHAPITTPQARASWVSTAASPFNPLRPACGAHASCGDFYSDFLRATHTSTAALRSRVAPATMRTYIQAGILGTP